MKKLGIMIGVILTLIISFTFVSHFFFKTNIQVSETFIKDERIPSTFDGARIIQFSDTLINDQADLALLQKVVNKINKTQPDIVVFTGDLFSADQLTSELTQQTQLLLSEIDASIMKLAVLGEHDLTYHLDLVLKTFEASNFTVLRNERLPIYNGSSEFINIIGLDSLESKTSYSSVLQDLDDKMFNLLLIHEPNLAPLMTDEAIDIQLSGHCLGINQTDSSDTPNKPNYCEQFYKGTYRFADQLILHVNEGINTSLNNKNPLKRPSIHSFLLLKS